MMSKNPLHRHLTCRLAVVLAVGVLTLPAQAKDKPADPAAQKVLRVCQDPNNLPMSNQSERGYENKIAALFADKLGWKLEHTWYPQRMGFIRNTLTAKIPDTDTYKCDLITGVSTYFERGLATKPYMTSTYAMVYVKGKGLDAVRTPDDLLKLDKAARDKLKIGIFTSTPAADWMLENGLMDQMVSYQLQTSNREQYPGQVIEQDLASGKLDVAIAWGPIAGYFAKKSSVPIEVVPFKPTANGIQYGFSIAMGTRYGEKAFRDQIDQLIASSQPEIDAILKDYGVPIVSASALPQKKPESS